MTSGPPPSARRRSGVRGRGCFVMIVLFLFFAGGFYVGVRAARHAMRQGPDWARALFRLPSGSAPQTLASPAVTPAPPPKTAPAVQPPATTSSPSTTSPTSPANGTGAPESPTPPPADLTTLVPQFNNILHRIQEAQQRYALAQQQAATKTKSQDLQPLLNEQESILKDMTAAVQRAKALQTQIKADPQFADSYQEAAPCLAPGEVPTRLLNLGLENLRFIELRSGGGNSGGGDNTNGT